jgi:hypothetical protein
MSPYYVQDEGFTPFFSLVLKELRAGAAKKIVNAQKLLNEMRTVESQIAAMDFNQKECMLCRGQMCDLALLTRLSVPVWTVMDYSYGVRIPKSWECQHCGAFITSAPRIEHGYWTPDNISPDSQSMAALLFHHFSFIDTVVLEKTAYEWGWLLEIETEWYFLKGPKSRVLEKLGIG